jgi:hypothetical protein
MPIADIGRNHWDHADAQPAHKPRRTREVFHSIGQAQDVADALGGSFVENSEAVDA